ncbi:hypothetical protein HPB50_007422 [Hyalomma asiaticum]|uniref:Uncharacterized protein n=1 Tax=Hyalomma asiaticum TaxID=266040 RepID=A0ACB7TDY8_HYAAI|nr:hypothetical protein HPB50_007422 [Hyalomma asiaticum]
MRMDSAAEKLASGTRRRKRKRRSSDDTPLTDFVKDLLGFLYNWLLDMCADYSELILESETDQANSGSVHSLGPLLLRLVQVHGQPVWLPANARAQIGDVRDLGPFLTGSYDFVLLDPPWENKSARRKRTYSMLSRDALLSALPLPRLASPQGCLVAVWCTANGANLRFVARELLPSWGLTYLATWYWVKVTKHGEPVRPFDCPHKKPYEFVVFGGPSSLSIPRDKVFVSVPSCIHSHKPPLSELVRPFVKNGAACLEVFARYLVPGWTSVGDEVLKLQHESLYEPASLASSQS